LVHLVLTTIEKPVLAVDYTYDCQNTSYTLWGESNRGYHEWSSVPADPMLLDHAFDDTLYIVPDQDRVYMYTADYADEQRCANTYTVALPYLERTKAMMSVQPSYLSMEQLTLTATDMSTGEKGRLWFVNGEPLLERSQQIRYEARPDADSVLLMLAVSTGPCTDTAYKVLPFIHSSLYFPNVFMPVLAGRDNASFCAYHTGITHYEINIYNRSGLLMFHSTDPNECWDGTYRGKYCPQGSYTYIAKYKDRITPGNWQYKKGVVLLIK
ncbi:MAG: gliding motility-associated C-terminal domain-containing protein, partial [Bacteroidales bacterium]|nr:gliding motility-associated C-terminal domain-containing protein [Candidatus Colimorpha onthohippi]